MALARRVAVALLTLAAPSTALAGPCLEWRQAETIGTLDTSLINEASGIAVSRSVAGRLYHNNDSGDGPYFYQTDGRGGETRRIAVDGFVPRDVEDIAVGPCAGAASCLFLGDIGDNARNRESVTFVELAEQPEFADTETPLRQVMARYPDGPHNAESFAIHPDGDLFLVTKALDRADRTTATTQIFRLSATQLADSSGAIQTFELVGTIDLRALMTDELAAQGATAMAISADGGRTLILTYRAILEWQHDLSRPLEMDRSLEAGIDYSLTPLQSVAQAEAIALLPAEDAVVYSTELLRGASEAPLREVACARR